MKWFLTEEKIRLYLLSTGVGFCVWLYKDLQTGATLRAKEDLRIEYDKKYEGVISDYVALRISCDSAK